MRGRPLSVPGVAFLTAAPVLAAGSAAPFRPISVKASRFGMSAPAKSLPPARPRAWGARERVATQGAEPDRHGRD